MHQVNALSNRVQEKRSLFIDMLIRQTLFNLNQLSVNNENLYNVPM